MSKWSEELQEKTRLEVFPGAVLKDENHNYGIFTEIEDRIYIKGVSSDSLMLMPTEETIATFGSIMEMVDAGWVLD